MDRQGEGTCPGDPPIQIGQSAEDPTRKGPQGKIELTRLTEVNSSGGGNTTEFFLLLLEGQQQNYK